MSTTPVNAGLSNLLQSLSSLGSPALSSPKVLAALQNAPVGDIVKLSAASTELQGLNAILGNTSGSTDNSGFGAASSSDSLLSSLYSGTPANTSTDAFTALEQAVAQATPGTASPAVATALANYQQSSQADLAQTLFGNSASTSVFG